MMQKNYTKYSLEFLSLTSHKVISLVLLYEVEFST